ncbi:hypothetical protein ACFPZL_10585, partial [Leucobacter soli]|uniref:hypothetical protein n=1 Tax=Leucobacter soli TaxID=2812850 RepID=UPI003622CECB
LERLSEPVLRAGFGVPSAEVEAAIAAPGLNEALSRAGSLTAAALAYSDRNVARETTVRPGGGWPGFVEALLRRLVAYGVDLIDAEVTEASRTESGGWTAALADGRALGSAALILDAGSTPARPGTDPGAGAETTSGAGLATPLPERTRLHAEIDIQEVPGLEELDAAGSAVRTVGRFSLVIHPADAEGSLLPRAELRGLAEAGGRPSAAVDPAAPLVDELSAALAEAGVDPAEDAGWRIRVAAAPFATTAERDRSRAALSERRAHLPELLVVGRALHGDDISAAVSDAQQEAIVLRRRLLGIAD